MSKILITGVAGMIGSNLCDFLLKNTEHEIIGIDNLSTGYAENLSLDSRFKFLKLDCVNTEKINDAFKSYRPDICYCIHSYAAEGRSNYIRSFIHLNNTVSVSNIINCCVNYGVKLIFTSSVAVYSGNPPYTEEMLPNPIDEYGLSKYTSERSIQIAGETQGLEYMIIRPRNVYGIKQSLWDTARNLFGIFCYQALNNQPLTIFGDGSNRRQFTYVEDILQPLYNAINYNNQIVNLGSSKSYSIKEAQEIFSEITGYNNVVHLEPRHEVAAPLCSTEKAEQMLNYKDETSIYNGLIRMWAYARNAPKRDIMTPPALEVFKTNHSSIK